MTKTKAKDIGKINEREDHLKLKPKGQADNPRARSDNPTGETDESYTDKLAQLMLKSHIEDILRNYSSPWRIIRTNFLVGLSRGVGMTVGTAIFLALLFYVLSNIVTMPFIGEYIAELIEWVEVYRNF